MVASSDKSNSIASNDESVVRLENVSVRFGSQEVLRNLDFEVPQGQTLAVIGESGCGKTVLLKTVIGLIRPTMGRVWFDRYHLAEMRKPLLMRIRRRFGFVFQQAALFDSMTIGQNVAFPLRQHGRYSEQDIHRIVRERVEEVGLPESVLKKKPAELSGGMRKRVGLARALVLDPELVLYDEPTTGLDPIMADVINELILRSRRQHAVTSMIVTHDMRTARKVADRVVMLYPLSRLEPGEPQILFDGPPSELDQSTDRRVVQFVRGEAGERLMELRRASAHRSETRHG